jgi:hypothetical protein
MSKLQMWMMLCFMFEIFNGISSPIIMLIVVAPKGGIFVKKFWNETSSKLTSFNVDFFFDAVADADEAKAVVCRF